MHLQPLVAPPYSVGARIARPFISDVITTFRAGARRGLGATAKPLYPIDGKAVGLDRRIPQTSLLEGGGPSADGGRSRRASRARRHSANSRFPSPRPPSSMEGDRPQRWKEYRTRCFYAEYLFLPTHTGHMKHTKHMKYKSRFFGKTVAHIL